MTATTDSPPAPTAFASCPLARAGGAAVIDIDGGDQLAAEARSCSSQAVEGRVTDAALDEWDRGNPDRWMDSATGGDLLHSAMHSIALRRQLQLLTGLEWEPLAQLGTYSYYRRPGHYLGAHRDIVGCDLSVVIVCEISGDGGGGDLVTYPSCVRSPLSAVRTAASGTGRTIPARPGQAAVLFGGLVPHHVTMIEGDRQRVVAPLCFRLRR